MLLICFFHAHAQAISLIRGAVTWALLARHDAVAIHAPIGAGAQVFDEVKPLKGVQERIQGEEGCDDVLGERFDTERK